ncbi:CRISPR-associated protein Cas4 [Candidatus Soleaferrea massiliensis]|uniref:CRISPR-associated protein Cas4 n=1 Tax=Candidatus Soleaferrea massiliensis TaxID=1470354 RepID=UPI00058C46AB|nr:CRISPR-associated protein Cas4 [Candidatus Soleaferrea massiliensis]
MTEDYLALSGIQHYCFCSRQWALIHLEQQWADNTRTYGGSQMHQRADDPYFTESRGDVRISRSLPLSSDRLRLRGVADVVEFHRCDEADGIRLEGETGFWKPVPIEYKYGQEKEDHSDLMQLTAQAICLEEMFKIDIPVGYLYYGKTRRRFKVEITAGLREEAFMLAAEMYQYLESGETPAAVLQKHCQNCSLQQLCVPKLSKKSRSISSYWKHMMEDEEDA